MNIMSQQAQTYMETWCSAILLNNEYCVSTGTDLCGNVVQRHLVEE